MRKNLLLRRPLLPLLFLLSYLLFLLASLPAAQILPRLPLPAGLQLREINGTLWQGRIGEVSWQNYRLHDLQWEVLFSRLWLAMPALKLSLQDPDTAIATGIVGWRGAWQLSDWQVKTSASTVQNWLAIPLPADVSGALQLNIKQLIVNRTECQILAGQLHWQQAVLQTPAGELSLGSPSAELSCQETAFDANIRQDSAALHSQAALQLNMQGRYKLQATLQPTAEFPANLRPALDWLGTSVQNGAIQVKHEGNWPDR